MNCPCHSGENYGDCCGPYHSGDRACETALMLMRSRYSAYALDLTGYIIETTHPKSPLYEKDKEVWKKSIHHFSKTTAFQGLTIDSFDETHVTFFARLNTLGKDTSFREASLFEKLKGRWYYLGSCGAWGPAKLQD